MMSCTISSRASVAAENLNTSSMANGCRKTDASICSAFTMPKEKKILVLLTADYYITWLKPEYKNRDE